MVCRALCNFVCFYYCFNQCRSFNRDERGLLVEVTRHSSLGRLGTGESELTTHPNTHFVNQNIPF